MYSKLFRGKRFASPAHESRNEFDKQVTVADIPMLLQNHTRLSKVNKCPLTIAVRDMDVWIEWRAGRPAGSPRINRGLDQERP